MGFPHETYDLALDTIRINKHIDAADRNAYAFTPFTGTPLRDMCNKLGYLKENDIVHSIFVNGSLLNMPQFPRQKINALLKTFNLYVKFPESRWPEIKKAEEDTAEGHKIFDALKEEFMQKFWKTDSTSFEDANTAQPMNT